jgi:hypothetical protein
MIWPKYSTNPDPDWLREAMVVDCGNEERGGGDGEEDLEAIGEEEDREIGCEDGGETDEVV